MPSQWGHLSLKERIARGASLTRPCAHLLATLHHSLPSRKHTACSAQLGDQPGTCNSDASARSIVVQITDQCPQCESNHWDVQALTWAKVRVLLAG